MSKTTINGIDVSEEIRYCNNCSNLGLDLKARKFYCSLSYRPDELPEVLSCDEFNTNCYIKCLQEENETLKKKLQYSTTWEYLNKANRYKQALEEIRSYCDEQNLKADYTACFITNRIDEVLNDRD